MDHPGARIRFQTNEVTSAEIRYGSSAGMYSHTQALAGSTTSHDITLAGLYPGVTYH